MCSQFNHRPSRTIRERILCCSSKQRVSIYHACIYIVCIHVLLTLFCNSCVFPVQPQSITNILEANIVLFQQAKSEHTPCLHLHHMLLVILTLICNSCVFPAQLQTIIQRTLKVSRSLKRSNNCVAGSFSLLHVLVG